MLILHLKHQIHSMFNRLTLPGEQQRPQQNLNKANNVLEALWITRDTAFHLIFLYVSPIVIRCTPCTRVTCNLEQPHNQCNML